MAKLGEVCDILNGYAFKSNQYTTSGVRIIRISNVQKGYIEDKSPVYYPCDDENVKKYELKQNDLLISLTGNVGRTALLEEKFLPAALNQRVSCIRLKEPDKVLKTYLFHLLNSDYFEQQCMKAAEGVAQKNLSPKWLFEYKIPIYSIERQKEISNTLDKIDLLIILRKQQLAKLDELVKARFVEMFGDPIGNTKNLPVTKFVDVVKMQRGFDLPVQERKSDGMIPVYGSNGVLGYHDISKVKGGGVITGRSGTIGKVFYEKEEFWPLNTTLFSLNLHGNDVVYLKYLLELFDLSRFTEGTGVPTLNRNKFHDELIIDVPLDEQERFAAFVERVDQQKQTVQQSLEKLELMKKALMQEYFG